LNLFFEAVDKLAVGGHKRLLGFYLRNYGLLC
jgi:hypothetical protein